MTRVPKMPDRESAIDAARAAEALDGLLSTRPGWTSTDRGWHHDATGITVDVMAGISPFRLTRDGATGSPIQLLTRTALDLFLVQAGC